MSVGMSQKMWQDACNNYRKEIKQLQAENDKLKESVKFLTKYDDDIDGLQAENKRLKGAINQALPSISSAMGDYNDARYIDIEVLYDALKDK